MTDKTPDACRLLARLPNNRQGRAALKVLRTHWNREGWRLRVLFSGPRTGWSTQKADAHTFRLYADRTGLTSYEKHAEQYRASERAERDALREKVRHLETALMGAEQNLRTATADFDLEHVLAVSHEAQAQHWHRIAMSRQRQLNEIPAWILYAVAFYRDTRGQVALFLANLRRA